MTSVKSSLIAMTLAAILSAQSAAAQEPTASAAPSLPDVSYMLAFGAGTGTAPATIIRLEDPQRAKLERQVRLNRGVLIGTSAVAATGLSLWMAALARKCNRGFQDRADLTCTQSGKVMRATGMAFFGASLTGMFISATMLFVRKRQLKNLGSLVQARKSRALRWDPASSQFVF